MKSLTVYRVLTAALAGAVSLFAHQSTAHADNTIYFDNWQITGWTPEGMDNFAKNIRDELQQIGKAPLTYVLTSTAPTWDTGIRRCKPRDLCVTFTNESPDKPNILGITTPTEAQAAPNGRFTKVYMLSVNTMADTVDHQKFGTHYGQIIKNATMHEFGHQMLMRHDDTLPASYMTSTFTPTIASSALPWNGSEVDLIRRFYSTPLPVPICPCPPTPPVASQPLPAPPEWVSFFSSFDQGDPEPTWNNFLLQRSVSSTVTRRATNGQDDDSSFLIQGLDASFSRSYAYAQVYDVNIPVEPSSAVQYSIFPGDMFGKFVAVDLVFTDGTTLRDSMAVDTYGVRAHPAYQGQSTHVIAGQWNVVTIFLYEKCKDKIIDKILIGYDQPNLWPAVRFNAWIGQVYVGPAT